MSLPSKSPRLLASKYSSLVAICIDQTPAGYIPEGVSRASLMDAGSMAFARAVLTWGADCAESGFPGYARTKIRAAIIDTVNAFNASR